MEPEKKPLLPGVRLGKLPKWFSPRIRRGFRDVRFVAFKELSLHWSSKGDFFEALRDKTRTIWDHYGQCSVRSNVLVCQPYWDLSIGWDIWILSTAMDLEWRMMAETTRKRSAAFRIEFRPAGSPPGKLEFPGRLWYPPDTRIIPILASEVIWDWKREGGEMPWYLADWLQSLDIADRQRLLES